MAVAVIGLRIRIGPNCPIPCIVRFSERMRDTGHRTAAQCRSSMCGRSVPNRTPRRTYVVYYRVYTLRQTLIEQASFARCLAPLQVRYAKWRVNTHPNNRADAAQYRSTISRQRFRRSFIEKVFAHRYREHRGCGSAKRVRRTNG